MLSSIVWNQISKRFVSGIYDIPKMADEDLFVSEYKLLFFLFCIILSIKQLKSGILQVIMLMLKFLGKASKFLGFFLLRVDVKRCLSQAAGREVESN